MELAAVLLMCAVMALVLYRVASRPLLARESERLGRDEAGSDARTVGLRSRRRPF
jgi:hypothetical protein